MKTTWLSLGLHFLPVVGVVAAPVVIDHTAVTAFDSLTDAEIARAKQSWFSIAGASHASGYTGGCLLLMEANPQFKVGVVEAGEPEPFTTNNLRISRAVWGYSGSPTGWKYGSSEEDWYTSKAAVDTLKRGILFCTTNGPQLTVLGFGWSWQMSWHNELGGGTNEAYGTRWAGSSVGGPDGDKRWGLSESDYKFTGNRISMDTYLKATQELRDFCRSNGLSTEVIFTTAPMDYLSAGEGSYQAAVKNDHIRKYVQNTSDGVLFDYADILCWDGNGINQVAWTNHNGELCNFPIMAEDNWKNLDGTEAFTPGWISVGHIGQRGAVRLAKAIWVLLSRINVARQVPIDCEFNKTDWSLKIRLKAKANTVYEIESSLDLISWETIAVVNAEPIDHSVSLDYPIQMDDGRFYRARNVSGP